MRTLLLAALLASPLAAQSADPVEALSSRLALTDDQADLVAEIYSPDDPGSVWTLAVELLPTLDTGQRTALFERPEATARPERGARRGARGARGQRGEGRRGRDPARAAIVKAARDAALGLSPSTSADLDAALEGLSRRERAEAFRDGALPTSVEQLLTTPQIEVYRAQAAIQMQLRRAMRESRRG
ncbi:hypothetical protein [Rubrivirga sp.]|uniref:hypothetical protein n=1 Tax=Rubrivirga sp. TaxID=1885344 RepID=UPI003C76395C